MKMKSTLAAAMFLAASSLSLACMIDGPNSKGKEQSAGTVALEGLSMSYPESWKSMPLSGGGPMSPKAILQIPNGKGEAGSIRITHFPRMKGKNEANIQRWIAQTKRPDGSPATQADANLKMTKSDGIELTMVDLSGSIKATMRDAAKPNQRMIAAIIDHPKGPHFVVVVGDSKLITESEEAILAFMRSSKILK